MKGKALQPTYSRSPRNNVKKQKTDFPKVYNEFGKVTKFESSSVLFQ